MDIAVIESSPLTPRPPSGFTMGPAEWSLVGLIVLLCILLGVAQVLNPTGKKNILGSARWATQRDRNAARKRAIKQLKASKHTQVSLWINTPEGFEKRVPYGDAETVYLPDMNRGTSVIGGSGSGKSYTAMRPLMRSALLHEMPMMILDTDYPGLAKTVAPLADSLGYEVGVFAPGFPESQTCNIFDLIKSCRDGTGASQLAATFNKNFSLGQKDKSDPFFESAGELLTEATLLLTKALPYQDILMAYTILSDGDMVARVKGVDKIDEWLTLSYGQLMSTEKSERTVDGIKGTAAILFGKLMRPDILPALIGRTTIPLKLTGKKLLIFGVKQDIRSVVSPLIASVINALVSSNIMHGRREPLFLSLDEMPSMYFSEIASWLAEFRKYGLCACLGYQSLTQLKKTYGPDGADIIYTNTANKLFFNPQSPETAELFSKTLGEQDVVYRTRSRGKSSSTTEHRSKRRLLTADEFMQFAEGTCVLLSPGYGVGRKRFVPVYLDPLKISDREKKIEAWCEERWPETLQKLLSKGVRDTRVTPEEIALRRKEFHARLPMTEKSASMPIHAGLFSDL